MWPQMFANMARTANLLVVDLLRGCIFGLNCLCLWTLDNMVYRIYMPMLYEVNFEITQHTSMLV